MLSISHRFELPLGNIKIRHSLQIALIKTR